MSKINSLLKGANLYSIEYTGFLTLKFSISERSVFYNEFNDISIEYISGHLFENSNKNVSSEIFKIFSLNILNAEIKENNELIITFDNGSQIETVHDFDELADRNWMIKVLDNKNDFILNDADELFTSINMKKILD